MHVDTSLTEQRDDNAVHALNVLHVIYTDFDRNAVATQTASYAGLDFGGDVFHSNGALAVVRSGVGTCALRLRTGVELRVAIGATDSTFEAHMAGRWTHWWLTFGPSTGRGRFAVPLWVAT